MGAFDNYQPPTKGGAFSNYQPPAAPAAPAPQDLGTTAIWNKPANASWQDYVLAHLATAAKPLEGIVNPRQNINEALTLGSGLTAGTSGFIPGVRERTAQAESELDPQTRYALSGAGYMLDPGKLALAAKMGGAVAPLIGDYAGGILGSAVEGGGASALSAAGAGQDARGVMTSGGLGFLGGGALGAFGGVTNRGGSLPTSPTTQDYFAQAKTAYRPMNNILYDSASEVHPGLGIGPNPTTGKLDVTQAKNALSDWSGYKWNDARQTKAEIQTLFEKPQLSASDLHKSQRDLSAIAGSPTADVYDKLYAGHFADKINDIFANATPFAGVPTNAGPGYAAGVKAAGDLLTGQAKDSQRADVWKLVGGTPAGKDMGAQAGTWLADQAAREAANKPGVWAPTGSPYNQASTALAQTTGQPTPLSWYAKHFVLAPLAFTAMGEGMNAVTGGEGMGNQPWWARLGEELGAGLAYGGGMSGFRAATGAKNVARQQAAEAALRQTIGSRTMQNPAGSYTQLAPIAPPAPIRDALRALWFGRGASPPQ